MVIIGCRKMGVLWLSGPDQPCMASALLPDQYCSAMTHSGGHKPSAGLNVLWCHHVAPIYLYAFWRINFKENK